MWNRYYKPVRGTKIRIARDTESKSSCMSRPVRLRTTELARNQSKSQRARSTQPLFDLVSMNKVQTQRYKFKFAQNQRRWNGWTEWGSYRRRGRTKTLLLLETAHLVQAKIETERRCGSWWRQRLNVAITCTTCTWYKRCTSGTSSMAASWSNSRHESSQAILPLRGSHYERIRSHLHHPFKPSRAYLAPPLLLQQIQIQIQNHLHLLFRLVKAVFCSGIVFVKNVF